MAKNISLNPDNLSRLIALRSRARCNRLVVQSTGRPLSETNHGGLRLIDARSDSILAGAHYDLSIADAESCVDAELTWRAAQAAKTGGAA